jgi:hypothetical protein
VEADAREALNLVRFSVLPLCGIATCGVAKRKAVRLVPTVAILLASTTGGVAQGFPKQMQGVWTDTPNTCVLYKQRGVAGLKRDVASGATHFWVAISDREVRGTTRGRFVGLTGTHSVEVLDEENPNNIIDFTLRRDGFLEETVVGARASGMYLRCR